ncbi:unnamed protein product [Adineta ricciae]|uniref:ubiquitinyl hydrolase 1 n=1 Tax=Adineta ricciae TaxID=249248 RepID=A0A815AYG2_ADIRI|nr:unnamed protein product [Adineta ricciae]
MPVDFNLISILGEFLLYLIVDNITKFLVLHNRKEKRFHILIYECMVLGFLVGFISLYYHTSYALIFFLLIHIIGVLYSERGFSRSKNVILIFFGIIHTVVKGVLNGIYNILFRRTSEKTSRTKPIPKEYLYNFHLKPTNDLRLQQSSFVQTLPRPGIFNLHGTTCSLNALLQSLASLNGFYSLLQRNINLSRNTYDSVVPAFLNLMSQLRNDHRAANYKHWTTVVDTSDLISKFHLTYPNLLTPDTTTDVCELFQCMIDVLNNALTKQSSGYSTNVIEQVQNPKLTTFPPDYLNKLFAETEIQLHETITLDNLDAQTSCILQYVDLTWLLHHVQLGSLVKHTFSGQILHAHCCDNCSHVRFRAEPFQILPLAIPKTKTTVERIISQLTKIELMDSMSCPHCSIQANADTNKRNKQDVLLSHITTTLSPIVTSRRQYSDKIYSSTPISTSTNHIIPLARNKIQHRIKSQTMIANFPEVFCVQLKRFSYDRLSNTAMKLTTALSIEPEQVLDLSHLHYATWLGLSTHTKSYHYRLIAVCLHLSDNPSPSSTNFTQILQGHCVCLYRTDHNRWFLCDDERITEINQINHLFQTSYVTENCYLLFYEKCS